MRIVTLITLLLCSFSNSVANAQVKLRVKNPDPEKSVIMYYLPSDRASEDLSTWDWKVIGPNQTTHIDLYSQGLFRVACFLKNGASSPAQVTDKEVDLRSFAMTGKVYPLDLTYHEDRRGREVQIMSATLIDPETETEQQLTVAGNDAESELVDQVLRANWRATFEAVQGANVSGILDLDREAQRGGPIFTANKGYNRKLSELLAFEDAAGCHIIGRWIRDDGDIRGTFHFLVPKNNPDELSGTYKVDRQNRQYRWTAQRIKESDE